MPSFVSTRRKWKVRERESTFLTTGANWKALLYQQLQGMDLFATLSLHRKCPSKTKARARTHSLPVKGGKATSTIIMRREFFIYLFSPSIAGRWSDRLNRVEIWRLFWRGRVHRGSPSDLKRREGFRWVAHCNPCTHLPSCFSHEQLAAGPWLLTCFHPHVNVRRPGSARP